MSLKNYHLLKSQVLDFKFNDSGAHGSEHIEILLNAAGQKWRAVFCAFQSQSWNNDAQGNPIS